MVDDMAAVTDRLMTEVGILAATVARLEVRLDALAGKVEGLPGRAVHHGWPETPKKLEPPETPRLLYPDRLPGFE